MDDTNEVTEQADARDGRDPIGLEESRAAWREGRLRGTCAECRAPIDRAGTVVVRSRGAFVAVCAVCADIVGQRGRVRRGGR